MKRQLAVVAGLAVLSSPAFASKARMQALSQGTASSYIDDTRSIFLNPAKLNDMNNYVITEWGTASDSTDSETAPRAEGGFFKKADAISYGLYFGNEEGMNNSDKAGDSLAVADNNIELFFAGDMGLKWGARVQYSSNENKPTGGIKKESNVLGLGLGVITGGVEAYANLLLTDESKGGAAAGDKYEADMGMNLGASYMMNGMTFYVDYNKSGYETTVSSVKTDDVSSTDIVAGVAKKHELAAGSNMFMNLNYTMSKEENTKATGTAEKKNESSSLPLTIGFESEAASWLTLRASVAQNFVLGSSETTLGDGTKTEKTTANSTTVNAGATLNFGKLKVDGVIGTQDVSRSGTAGTKRGNLSTDNLMTRVAVNYWF